jgi:hypothetical protein
LFPLALSQVYIGVVAKGPSGVALNSSYQNRDNPRYKVADSIDTKYFLTIACCYRGVSLSEETVFRLVYNVLRLNDRWLSVRRQTDLGNAIVNFARSTPDGLLVFFPSYGVLQVMWRSLCDPGTRLDIGPDFGVYIEFESPSNIILVLRCQIRCATIVHRSKAASLHLYQSFANFR